MVRAVEQLGIEVVRTMNHNKDQMYIHLLQVQARCEKSHLSPRSVAFFPWNVPGQGSVVGEQCPC